MINRILVRKYVSASWLLFAACGLTLFTFAWVRVWVVSLLDMARFKTVLDQFRDFEKFAPIDFDSLLTYSGRVGMTFDEPVVIFCTVVWCIARGSDVVAGELGRGTLEMILAQPIRRRTLMYSHALVSVVGLALLTLSVWAGIAIGVATTTVDESVPPPTIRIPILNIDVPLAINEPQTISAKLSDRVDVAIYGPAVLNLFAFGFFLLGLSSLASSRDRYRWRAVGVVVTIYVIQIVMYGLGKATERLEWLLSWTFFSCYRPQKLTELVTDRGLASAFSLTEPIDSGQWPPMIYTIMLLALGGLFYAFATWSLSRRDLPAPL